MPDILLIQPPIRDFYLTAKRTIPYGLACIASALLREGFSVEILDALATRRSRLLPWPADMAHLEPYYGRPDVSPFALFHRFRHYGLSFDAIGRTAARSGAFLVGVSSLFTAYSDEALSTAEAIKAHYPRCTVVLGGHHPTEMPETVLQCSAVDYVLRGEGEVSMPRLAWALKEGRGVDLVPGIAFRAEDGRVEARPPAVMPILDDFPPPAQQLFDHSFYKRKAGGSAVVLGSRGCPLKCSYCSTARHSWMPYRRRRVESVLAELKESIRTWDVRFVDFEDENISLERSWFLELLAGIRERFGKLTAPGIELRAMNGLFPPSLDEEVVSAMKEAGFRTLNLSLGTVSEAQRKRFRRPDVREAFDRAVALARQHELDVVGYIIVGAPYQAPQDSLEDLLHLFSRQVVAGVSVFYPAPGSPDYRLCAEEGLLPPSFSLMRATALPLSHTTTREETVTLLRLGRLANFILSFEPIERRELATRPVAREGPLATLDRRAVGRDLLHRFFLDAALWGVTPDGEVYSHISANWLCRLFLERLAKLNMCPASSDILL